MNVTETEFEYMKIQLTARLIQMLVEEQNMPLSDAMDKIYTSDMFQKLSNPNTGLFFQSPRYVMSYLTQ